jgi:hypothetical protein
MFSRQGNPNQCPLSGVKPTYRGHRGIDAIDPERKSLLLANSRYQSRNPDILLNRSTVRAAVNICSTVFLSRGRAPMRP